MQDSSTELEDFDDLDVMEELSAPPSQIGVDKSYPGMRLDQYLKLQFPEISRSTFQRLIGQGEITLQGAPLKATHQPRVGEIFEIRWPAPQSSELTPENIPLEVLLEDDDLLVVNKPAGMVVHPAAGNEEHTLVHALLHHCKGSLSGIGGVIRPGIVHRLDKDTSGCIVVAKNDATHQHLAAQFEKRTVSKVYHALVCGVLKQESGDIRGSIARHPIHRKRMAVVEGGRTAWTRYKAIEYFDAATLVEAGLHTGRTHQIRVHFLHLGHPLVGDKIYGARPNARFEEQTGLSASRQMLHASSLSFLHPRSGEPVSAQAPWPLEFDRLVQTMRTIFNRPEDR